MFGKKKGPDLYECVARVRRIVDCMTFMPDVRVDVERYEYANQVKVTASMPIERSLTSGMSSMNDRVMMIDRYDPIMIDALDDRTIAMKIGDHVRKLVLHEFDEWTTHAGKFLKNPHPELQNYSPNMEAIRATRKMGLSELTGRPVAKMWMDEPLTSAKAMEMFEFTFPKPVSFIDLKDVTP